MSQITYSYNLILSLKSKYNEKIELKKFNVINPYLNRFNTNNNKYTLPKVGLNAWGRKKDNSDIEKCEKQINSILNKLTKEKFEKLSNDICNYSINDINYVYKIRDLIFNKAIELPTYSDLYVQLIQKINLAWIKKFNHNIYYPIYNFDNKKYYWTFHKNSITDYTNSNLYGPFFTSEKIKTFILKSTEKKISTYLVTNINILLLQINLIYIYKNKIYTIYLDKSSKKFFYKIDLNLFTNNKNIYNNSNLLSKDEIKKYACDSINFINLINNKVNNFFYLTLNNNYINLDEDDDELIIKKKCKIFGNIYLIAELYKNKLITLNVIYKYICLLLNINLDNICNLSNNLSDKISKLTNYDNLPILEINIECVCKLITELGNIIDTSRQTDLNLEKLDEINKLSYIGQFIYYLKKIIESDKKLVSSRIKFMIKDLIDCRNNNWIERNKKIKSSKLCKIK